MKLQISDVRKWGKYNIVANGVDGSSWKFKMTFQCDDYRVAPLLKKIDEAGEIDTQYWNKSDRRL